MGRNLDLLLENRALFVLLELKKGAPDEVLGIAAFEAKEVEQHVVPGGIFSVAGIFKVDKYGPFRCMVNSNR